MAHSLTSDMLAETLADHLMPILLGELHTHSGILYVWNGVGSLVWNSNTFLGVGNFLTISQVMEGTLVQASGFVVSLSGIPSALISIALQDLRRFLPMKMWLGALNPSFAIIADPYMFFNGRVDNSNILATGTTATISVAAESRLIMMKTPRWRRYTDQDQRIERPSDGGFKYVDFLQNAIINWHS